MEHQEFNTILVKDEYERIKNRMKDEYTIWDRTMDIYLIINHIEGIEYSIRLCKALKIRNDYMNNLSIDMAVAKLQEEKMELEKLLQNIRGYLNGISIQI